VSFGTRLSPTKTGSKAVKGVERWAFRMRFHNHCQADKRQYGLGFILLRKVKCDLWIQRAFIKPNILQNQSQCLLNAALTLPQPYGKGIA